MHSRWPMTYTTRREIDRDGQLGHMALWAPRCMHWQTRQPKLELDRWSKANLKAKKLLVLAVNVKPLPGVDAGKNVKGDEKM